MIDGGGGNDMLTGGSGNDILTGGDGDDTFVFGANSGDDTVTDFSLADDVLLFEDGIALTGTSSRTQTATAPPTPSSASTTAARSRCSASAASPIPTICSLKRRGLPPAPAICASGALSHAPAIRYHRGVRS